MRAELSFKSALSFLFTPLLPLCSSPFALSLSAPGLFDSQTCRDLNPEVFKLTFWLIVIQYTLMMLPCVLLLCLAPMVFCCLPLLIRMSLILPPGVGLRMLDQEGASQDLIAKLPPAARFKRGMFGGAAQEVPAASASASGEAPEEEKTASSAGGTSPGTNHDEPEW